MADIIHKFVIDGQKDKIYEALSTQEGLGNWWTKDCIARPEEDSVAEFYFHNRHYEMKMKVKKLNTNDTIVWECVAGDPEWIGTMLNFKLTPHEKGTSIAFAHEGWESTDKGYGHCNFTWAHYFLSLRSYVETGQGQPHTG